MKPLAQCLSMSPCLDNESLTLIELDNNILEGLLNGNSLIVRGNKTDSAVLCTSNDTFELKGAETSNSLLILPHCSINAEQLDLVTEPSVIACQICSVKHDYFELRRIKPRLKRLQELLEENPYSGERSELEKSGHKYTHLELLERIQASEAELGQGLERLKACLIDDRWRILDFEYMSAVLNSILAARDEMAWPDNCIYVEPLCTILQELYPNTIVVHVLRCFADTVSDSSANEVLYKLNEASVCRFIGEMLLHAAHRYNLSEFLEAWQLAVPDNMTTNLKQLEGLVLVDRSSRPEIISYFHVDDLPEEIEDRFRILFGTKEKWTLEEITPYVEGVCVDGKSGVGTLLTKYARVSTQKGVKLYSSRR